MRLILCALVQLAVTSSVHAGERYFVTFYAAQRSNYEPHLTHSFAVFTRATSEGATSEAATSEEIAEEASEDPDAESGRCESFTISWMPASGVIRLLAPPETGKNFTLSETLQWAKARGLRTTSWGPYEISLETYDQAREQKRRLESGAVLYKALDRRLRPNNATNCIHALTDLIPGPLLSTGSAAGDSATAMIVAHYRPHLVDFTRTHAWVLRAAGLAEGVQASSSD